MEQKIVITGGFGNLGAWLTNHLAKKNYEVNVLGRTVKDIGYPNIKFAYCDLTQKQTIIEFFDQRSGDIVIHLASFNEYFEKNYFEKALKINTEGTYHLLQSLNQSQPKHFIYFSTFHVYGRKSGVIDESTICEPKNDYASTHLFAEYIVKQYCSKYNIPYTIIRLTNSYGCPKFIDSSKWYLVLNDLAKTAVEKGKIILTSNGGAKRDFIWMGDVVNIVEKMFLKKRLFGETCNLGSEESFSVLYLAKVVQKIYSEKYNQTLPIETNKNDKSNYDTLEVSCKKLKSIIPYQVKLKFEEEVRKMFDLLPVPTSLTK